MNLRVRSKRPCAQLLLYTLVAVSALLLWPAAIATAQTNAYMDTVVVSTTTPTVTTYVNQPVTVYFAATGGAAHNGTECHVTGGPTYTWQSDKGTILPPNGQSTCGVSVSFPSPGPYTLNVSCTMAYTTDNCGNLSGSGPRSVTIYVLGATVSLQSVNFGGSRATIYMDNGTYAYDSTQVTEPSPDYSTGGAAAAVCFIANSGLSATATFKVTSVYGSPTATFSMSASGGGGTFSGTSGSVTIPGTVGRTFSVSFSCSGNMASTIDNGTLSASFAYAIGGGSSQSAGSSSNTLFVVLGQPGGGTATYTRVNRVTNDCKGLSSQSDIVNAIWTNEVGPLVAGKNFTQPIWGNLDGNTGMCKDIISLMIAAIQMTGSSSPGVQVYIYPDLAVHSAQLSSDGSSYITRPCGIGQGSPAHTTGLHSALSAVEEFGCADSSARMTNLYECCYLYNSTLYPGGEGSTTTYAENATGEYEVLKPFTSQTEWYWLEDKTTTPYTWSNCDDPGPDPQAYW